MVFTTSGDEADFQVLYILYDYNKRKPVSLSARVRPSRAGESPAALILSAAGRGGYFYKIKGRKYHFPLI